MKTMLRWCSCGLLMVLVLAAMLLLPAKASALPVLTLKSPAVVFEGAVRHVPYGSFLSYGYEQGDRLCLLTTVNTDGTVNTPTKQYLDFSTENGTQQSTVVSTGNAVSYALTLTNPSNARLSDVPVRIILPEQVTLLSADGMTLTDNVLTWTDKVNGLGTVTLS